MAEVVNVKALKEGSDILVSYCKIVALAGSIRMTNLNF